MGGIRAEFRKGGRIDDPESKPTSAVSGADPQVGAVGIWMCGPSAQPDCTRDHPGARLCQSIALAVTSLGLFRLPFSGRLRDESPTKIW